MSRSRNLLHKNKLPDFIRWLEFKGYQSKELKGDYEVARVQYAGHPPLIIYTKENAKEHYTLYGDILRLYNDWIRSK